MAEYTKTDLIKMINGLPDERKAFESDYKCEMSNEQAMDYARMIVDTNSDISKFFKNNYGDLDAVEFIANGLFHENIEEFTSWM